MIKFLTDYSTGSVLLDRFADVCVIIIVTVIVAFIVWHFAGDRDDKTTFETSKSSTRD